MKRLAAHALGDLKAVRYFDASRQRRRTAEFQCFACILSPAWDPGAFPLAQIFSRLHRLYSLQTNGPSLKISRPLKSYQASRTLGNSSEDPKSQIARQKSLVQAALSSLSNSPALLPAYSLCRSKLPSSNRSFMNRNITELLNQLKPGTLSFVNSAKALH